MGHSFAEFMDKHKPPLLKVLPRGACPDCHCPLVEHYNQNGLTWLGCPTEDQPMWTRQLAASAHVQSLATVLAMAHWKYEGWGSLPLPLDGELKRIYESAAEFAVRFCSEADRHVAESRATQHALHAVGKALIAPQFTPDTIAQGVKVAIHEALDIYRHSLMHGTASPVELADIVETLDSLQESK